MRTRSRIDYTDSVNKVNMVSQRYYPDPNTKYGGEILSSETFSNSIVVGNSTIKDEVNRRSLRDRHQRRSQLIRAARRLYTGEELVTALKGVRNSDLQVHTCEHTIQKITSKETNLVGTSPYFGGVAITSANFQGLSLLCKFLGGVGSSAINRWNSTTKSYTSSDFRTHDWFSLLDRWHEACNSFVPSSSLIGESMIENAIFIDAFKILLNPTRGVKLLVDLARKGLFTPKTPIGKLRSTLRTSADTFLGYNFGIKPAIDEVINIFTAHSRVQSRLNFLRQNAGQYVPVRVRHTLPSDIFNQGDPTGTSEVRILCESKETTGVISCQAQVRNDLSFSEDWKAYVQHFGLHKVIGLGWELVPFSFVIDWISNVGDYINRYTTPALGSPFYNIRGVTHSVKQEVVEVCKISKDTRVSNWVGQNLNLSKALEVGRMTSSTYKRYPRLPTTSGFVDFSNLGTFHSSASGALLIQKIIK